MGNLDWAPPARGEEAAAGCHPTNAITGPVQLVKLVPCPQPPRVEGVMVAVAQARGGMGKQIP